MSSEDDTSKFEKFKQHLKDHQMVYAVSISSVSCLAMGTLVGMQFRDPPEMLQIIKPKQTMALAYKCSQEMTNIILQAKGDPGDVVQRVGTNLRWASKGELARDLDIARAVVSKYFAGELPDLAGFQYEVIGKAGHPISIPA
jgi:hypothetical protein